MQLLLAVKDVVRLQLRRQSGQVKRRRRALVEPPRRRGDVVRGGSVPIPAGGGIWEGVKPRPRKIFYYLTSRWSI